MRIRTIKPEFWQHEMHGKISETAALLAVALLNYADDEGRFKVQFAPIRSLLFTYRESLQKPLQEAFKELEAVRYVFRYTARIDDKDVELGQIVTFRRHQVINKPLPSRLPAAKRTTTGELPDASGNTDGGDKRTITGELPEDSCGKDRREGVQEGREGEEGDARAPEGFSEPTMEEVVAYGERCGLSRECCEKFFHENKAAGWIDRHRRQIVVWQNGLMAYGTAWRSTEAEKKNRRTGQRPDVGNVNHIERKTTDRPEWWMMSLVELRDQAMSLAQSSDEKNKKAAARVAEIIAIREKEGAR